MVKISGLILSAALPLLVSCEGICVKSIEVKPGFDIKGNATGKSTGSTSSNSTNGSTSTSTTGESAAGTTEVKTGTDKKNASTSEGSSNLDWNLGVQGVLTFDVCQDDLAVRALRRQEVILKEAASQLRQKLITQAQYEEQYEIYISAVKRANLDASDRSGNIPAPVAAATARSRSGNAYKDPSAKSRVMAAEILELSAQAEQNAHDAGIPVPPALH